MARWLLIWSRNRLAALLGLALAAAYGGAFAIACLRYLGDPIGLVVGAVGSLALLVLIATHPTLKGLAERMAADERNLRPGPRW